MSNSTEPSSPPQNKSGLPLSVVLLLCTVTFCLGLLIAALKLNLPALLANSEPETPPNVVKAQGPPPVGREEQTSPPSTAVMPPIQVSPTQPVGEKITAIRTLSKEFDFISEVEFSKGELTSAERTQSQSYLAEYKLSIREPRPALTYDEVIQVTPSLADHLPACLLYTSDAADD